METSPLPPNAATATAQAAQSALLTSIDGKTPVLTGGKTPVDLAGTVVPLPTGAATEAKQDVGNTTLGSIDTKIVVVNTGAVTVAASALPTGASTSANQTTANTSLSSLDTKVGEVQANPTANTILGRLKDVLTMISLAAGSALIGKVQLRNPGNTADMGDSTNPVFTENSGATVSHTTVSANTAGAELLPANANRKGLILSNASGNRFFIKYETTTTITSTRNTATDNHTVIIESNTMWEMPHPIYTGRITVISDNTNANRFLQVTEIRR